MAVGTQEPQDCAGHGGGGGKGVCGEPFTLDDCFFSPLGPVANFLPQMLLLGTHSEPDQELWSSARNTGVISVSRSASSLSIYSIFLSLAICPWICLFGEKKMPTNSVY